MGYSHVQIYCTAVHSRPLTAFIKQAYNSSFTKLLLQLAAHSSKRQITKTHILLFKTYVAVVVAGFNVPLGTL